MAVVKLGPHVIRPTESALVWARAAPIVKALDDTAALRAAGRARVRVFRRYFPVQDVGRSGAAVVDEVLGALGDAPATHIELFNETAQRLGHGLERHVACTREAVGRLHDRRPDLTLAAFSFSTGNPEPEDWAYLRAEGYGGASCLAIHEYWGAQGFSTWNALRYRRVHEWTEGDHPPFLVTECGRDRVEGGNGGWRADGLGDDAYLAELRAYDAELARDPYVVGAVVFTAGPTDDWRAFSTDGIEGTLAADAGPLPDWTPVAPIPAPQPAPNPGGGSSVDTYDDWTMPKRTNLAVLGNFDPSPRPRTIGVVVHSSGGEASSLGAEFSGTVNWFQNPVSGVSAHAVVGVTEVARCVPEDQTAYHARENNADHLGLELAWPDTPGMAAFAYPVAYYAFAGEVIARWSIKYGFPLRWATAQGEPGLICHRDTAAGRREDKRDPTGRFAPDALLASAQDWLARIGASPAPTPTPPPPPATDNAGRFAELWVLKDRLYALGDELLAQGDPRVSRLAQAVKGHGAGLEAEVAEFTR